MHTIFKRDEALVRDLELEGIEESRRVIQDGDVGDVHSAHRRWKQALALETFIQNPNPSHG